jgi:hypothetical protein
MNLFVISTFSYIIVCCFVKLEVALKYQNKKFEKQHLREVNPIPLAARPKA